MTRAATARGVLARGAMRVAVAAGLALAVARPAHGQVGYNPPESPFKDLEYRQELTALAGYFSPSSDIAGVAPQGGPLVGLRYEVRIGGPAQLMVRAMRVGSERRLIDASVASPARESGTRSEGLYLADVGISVNLTGQKTWHGIIPVIHVGGGIASDFHAEADAQTDTTQRGYQFGTPFALSFGGGMRWAPGGRLQLRADVGDFRYQVKYPASFFTAPAGVTPVLANDVKQNQWKHNLALTLGASYLFFR
jgi:hypothetical protein